MHLAINTNCSDAEAACATAVYLQLDRTATVVEKTIARKTSAGKYHFCMHTKQSGRARQRDRKKCETKSAGKKAGDLHFTDFIVLMY